LKSNSSEDDSDDSDEGDDNDDSDACAIVGEPYGGSTDGSTFPPAPESTTGAYDAEVEAEVREVVAHYRRLGRTVTIVDPLSRRDKNQCTKQATNGVIVMAAHIDGTFHYKALAIDLDQKTFVCGDGAFPNNKWATMTGAAKRNFTNVTPENIPPQEEHECGGRATTFIEWFLSGRKYEPDTHTQRTRQVMVKWRADSGKRMRGR
jgi:hypothetical protein